MGSELVACRGWVLLVAMFWTLVWLLQTVVALSSAISVSAGGAAAVKLGAFGGALLPVSLGWVIVWKLYAFWASLKRLEDGFTNHGVEEALNKQSSFWLWLGGLCALMTLMTVAIVALAGVVAP